MAQGSDDKSSRFLHWSVPLLAFGVVLTIVWIALLIWLPLHYFQII